MNNQHSPYGVEIFPSELHSEMLNKNKGGEKVSKKTNANVLMTVLAAMGIISLVTSKDTNANIKIIDPINISSEAFNQSSVGKLYHPPVNIELNRDDNPQAATNEETEEEPVVVHKHHSQKELDRIFGDGEEPVVVHKHHSQEELNKIFGVDNKSNQEHRTRSTFFNSFKQWFGKVSSDFWRMIKKTKKSIFSLFSKKRELPAEDEIFGYNTTPLKDNTSITVTWRAKNNQGERIYVGEVLWKNNPTSIPRKEKYIPWQYPDDVVMWTWWWKASRERHKNRTWEYPDDVVMWTWWWKASRERHKT